MVFLAAAPLPPTFAHAEKSQVTTKSVASLTLCESILGIGWCAMLMASAFAFPNWLANAVMVLSTCFAVSLILLAFILKSQRGRLFGAGAVPPLLIAVSEFPKSISYLPFVYTTFDLDPFDPSPLSNFYRVAIVMHFVAAFCGYGMLIVTSALYAIKSEP